MTLGDKDTDYANNQTSSEKGGFYTQDSSVVTYSSNNIEKTMSYRRPVIQPHLLEINKIDESDKKLPGAEFTLTQVADTTGYRNYPVSLENSITVKITDKDGNAVFLLPGGEYTLTETNSPSGYNKLNGTVSITQNGLAPKFAYPDSIKNDVSENNEEPENSTISTGVSFLKVTNRKSYILPETGGFGLSSFRKIGFLNIVLAGGICCWSIFRKRKANV